MRDSSLAGRRVFILAHTGVEVPSLVPEIRLHMASEAHDLWAKTEAELADLGFDLESAPPYWAFAWAGGQALARHLLDHPDLVAGRVVLDIATGSGLVAIAAARARAARVIANDIDPCCAAAVALNADLNGVCVDYLARDLTAEGEALPRAEVVLAGDIAYDRIMTPAMFTLLQQMAGNGVTVLIGDPGRAYLPKSGLELLGEYQVDVPRALEDSEVKRCRVWRLLA